MEALRQILADAPEIALFAALALGQALGRVRLGAFCLGGVAGSLLVALVIGQLGVTVTYAISNVLLAVWGPLTVAFT